MCGVEDTPSSDLLAASERDWIILTLMFIPTEPTQHFCVSVKDLSFIHHNLS